MMIPESSWSNMSLQVMSSARRLLCSEVRCARWEVSIMCISMDTTWSCKQHDTPAKLRHLNCKTPCITFLQLLVAHQHQLHGHIFLAYTTLARLARAMAW